MSVNSLGIDIGGTNTHLGLVDSQGNIVARTHIPTLMGEGPESLVERIVSRAGSMAADEDIAQVGVGIAGLIDHHKGIVRFSPNLVGWKNVQLKDMLHGRFGVPVAVGNDVNVICWGEYRFGGYGTEHLFCFTLGTGVGGGIVSDGRLILGANDAAGEFGHTSFERHGLECLCGLTGCLESYVGARNLIAMAERRAPMTSRLTRLASTKELTPEVLAQAAEDGDKVAQGIFREAGERIGRALGNVVQLLDPEVIVVNGGISKAGELIIKPIRESLKHYTMPLSGRKLRVVRSRLGDRAGILGAAVLAEILA
jgi:glucokinase